MRILAWSCILLLLVDGLVALGSDARDTTQVLITMQALQHLHIDSSVAQFPPETHRDVSRGYLEFPEAVRLTVCSNVPWCLVISSKQEKLKRSAREGKPLNHLLWKVAGGTEGYHSLTQMPRVIRSSSQYADHEVIDLDLRLSLDNATDVPGDYALDMCIDLQTVE